MEYYLGILNRTYQIFVTPTIIAGGFVNGMIAAPPGLLGYWFVPSRYARKNLVEKYKEVSPYSEDFKSKSPFFNFQYQRSEIQKVWYVPTLKWGMGTVAHSGKLYVKLASGRKREFILLGLQHGKEIVQHLMPDHSDPDSSDSSDVHALLKQVYELPLDIEAWARLKELFHAQGERAQEYYCRAYLQTLKRYRHNGA